jgi:hypothetical protein
MFVLYNQTFYGKFQIFLKYFYFFLFSKLHGKRTEINHDTDSNASSNNNEDNLSVKSLDLAIELTTENSSISPKSTNREKKAYLKSLEENFRRGGKMNKEENDENESHSNPLNFICRFINQHIRRRTTDTHETAQL